LMVNLIANIILIPWLGIVGASIATSISYAVIAVLCLSVYVRLTKCSWLTPLLVRRQDVIQSYRMVRSLFPYPKAS
jgi:O-antigen/teichoic acid export membrane protein